MGEGVGAVERESAAPAAPEHGEQQYLDLVRDVLESGVRREDRTGVGTLSKFGVQMRFDLSHDFPLLTTKQVHTKSIIHELLWFVAGDTNAHTLKDKGVSIWNEWADEDGDLGPVYGAQWRRWRAAARSRKMTRCLGGSWRLGLN